MRGMSLLALCMKKPTSVKRTPNVLQKATVKDRAVLKEIQNKPRRHFHAKSPQLGTYICLPGLIKPSLGTNY